MTAQIERLEPHLLGQFIPLHYHFNMLNDKGRMQGFKEALRHVVCPGAKVLELGGGTGVLSFFAAQQASRVYYVEQNPDLVEAARSILRQNTNGHRVKIIHADANHYLPPEPVDVVVCEMLHVGLLREKQASVLQNFKTRYLQKFGGPLPLFVPEACIQAVQPVQHDFDYDGFYAPTILFQDPAAIHEKTQELSGPAVFQMFVYDEEIPQTCDCNGTIKIVADGQLNALRLVTKNVLAVVEEAQSTIDWFNQYLIAPLDKPLDVSSGDEVEVRFGYPVGSDFKALTESIEIRRVGARADGTDGVDSRAAAGN